MKKTLTQDEKDKRTVTGLILAIIFIIIIIILVSYSYSEKAEDKGKRFEDPTIIQKNVGEDIETIDYIPSNNVVYLSNTIKKENKVQNNIQDSILIKEAERLVNIVEETYLEEDLLNAEAAVNKIKNEKEKEALNIKLENIKRYIEIDKKLTQFNNIINNAKSKLEIDKISLDMETVEKDFNDLAVNSKKEELKNKIDLILNIINDTKQPIVTLPTKDNNYYNESIVLNIEDDNEFVAIITNNTTNESKEVKNNDEITEEGEYTLVVTDKAQNVTTIDFVIDKEAPKTNSEFNTTKEIFVGAQYIEEGLSIIDNIDGINTVTAVSYIINNETKLEVDSIDTNNVGSYTIYYEATDKAGNSTILEKIVNVVENPTTINSYKAKTSKTLKTDVKQDTLENTPEVDVEKQVQEELVQTEETVEE